MFYFSNNNMSGEQMAKAIEKALPEIYKLCAKQKPPFFAAITRSGEINLKGKFVEL